MFGIFFFEIVRMERELKMIFNREEGIDIQDVDWIKWMACVEKY